MFSSIFLADIFLDINGDGVDKINYNSRFPLRALMAEYLWGMTETKAVEAFLSVRAEVVFSSVHRNSARST